MPFYYNSHVTYNSSYIYNVTLTAPVSVLTVIKVEANHYRATIGRNEVVSVRIGKGANKVALQRSNFDVQVTSNV